MSHPLSISLSVLHVSASLTGLLSSSLHFCRPYSDIDDFFAHILGLSLIRHKPETRPFILKRLFFRLLKFLVNGHISLILFSGERSYIPDIFPGECPQKFNPGSVPRYPYESSSTNFILSSSPSTRFRDREIENSFVYV